MRWFLGIVVVVLGLGFAAVVGLGQLQPLELGSTSGVGQHLLLGIQDADEVLGTPEGVDRAVTYRYEPGGRFTTMFTVRNSSALPVTVTSSSQPPLDAEGYEGFWMEDLAADPINRGGGTDEGVLDGPTLPPTTVAPGEELLVWARWRISAICDGKVSWQPAPDWPGGDSYSTASISVVNVRTEVLGVPQTTPIQLRDQVQMVNGGPDAVTECPPAA